MEWGQHAPITPRLGGTAERYRALAKSGPTEGFVHDLVLFRKRLRSLVVNLQLHSFVSSFPMSQIRQKSEEWGRSQPTGCAAQRRRSSLTDVEKDLREIQELLRHKNIRTTVRYTHAGYRPCFRAPCRLRTVIVGRIRRRQ
jgi:hypothetical protein